MTMLLEEQKYYKVAVLKIFLPLLLDAKLTFCNTLFDTTKINAYKIGHSILALKLNTC